MKIPTHTSFSAHQVKGDVGIIARQEENGTTYVYFSSQYPEVVDMWLFFSSPDDYRQFLKHTVDVFQDKLAEIEGDENEQETLEAVKRHEQRNADHIDGYDRDDLGESPDY